MQRIHPPLSACVVPLGAVEEPGVPTSPSSHQQQQEEQQEPGTAAASLALTGGGTHSSLLPRRSSGVARTVGAVVTGEGGCKKVMHLCGGATGACSGGVGVGKTEMESGQFMDWA